MRLDDIEQLLKSLGLRRMADLLPDELSRAKNKDVSHEELLQRLLRAQWQAKQESALNHRIKKANIPEPWMLETFPFAKQPGVSKR